MDTTNTPSDPQPQGAATEDQQLRDPAGAKLGELTAETSPTLVDRVAALENAAPSAATAETLDDRLSDLEARLAKVEPVAHGILAAVDPEAAKAGEEIRDAVAGGFKLLHELLPIAAQAQRGGHSLGSVIMAVGRQVLGLFQHHDDDMRTERHPPA